MAQIQVRTTAGAPIAFCNIRISEGGLPQEQAIFDVWTDPSGNTGWPIPLWPDRAFTLHVNQGEYAKGEFGSESRTVPGSGSADQIFLLPLTIQPPIPGDYPFPPEAGLLHIEGTTFRRQDGSLFQWRGYSWFLGFLRYCRGEDVIPDLIWMREMGVNIPRIFGPLPWSQTPDYRFEHFDFFKLGGFIDLLEAYGLRSNWSLGHYKDPQLKPFAQQFYDFAASRWSILVEQVNEPGVGATKPDPLIDFAGVDRHGVPTAYGYYKEAFDGQAGWPKVLDFGTIHIPRDSAWHRRARIAQEVQHATGKPWISDEPAKITEPGFDYPGGKNDPLKTPAEMTWHAGVCHLWTPGVTVHMEEGKWGRVPTPGMLQQTVMAAVLRDVWQQLDAEVQTGSYMGAHLSASPVHHVDGVWYYSSMHDSNQKAWTVGCDFSAPQPKPGWTAIERWGPAGSLVRLTR